MLVSVCTLSITPKRYLSLKEIDIRKPLVSGISSSSRKSNNANDSDDDNSDDDNSDGRSPE